MQPHNGELPSINPRRLVLEAGPPALAALLEQTGYVIQQEILRDLCHALRSCNPYLISGPRGGGKTALGEALAAACNLPVYYLQGMEGLTLSDVLYSWDTEGQTQWVRQAMSAGLGLGEARAQQWTREYLNLGEALAAYEAAASREDLVPVFMLDEIDKIEGRIEDMLLQLFGRGYAHVPRFGEIGVRDRGRWPIVILLSNDIRHDLSAPLRSRCVFSWQNPPTPREEVTILRARCREVPPSLIVAVVKMINEIRGMAGIVDKPGLRESIELIRALEQQGVKELSGGVIRDHLCFLGKRQMDLANLAKGLARLESAVRRNSTDYDQWMAEVDEREACHAA